MAFSTPLALVLLLVIPFVIYLGWPRLAYRRVRDSISLILRTLIMLLLVLTLAGAQTVQSTDRLAVVYLIDSSDSMGEQAREDAVTYVRDSISTMRPDDQAGVVLFGAQALVEKTVSTVRELGVLRSAPLTSNTDLEEAIRLALGMFPADTARRIVILSDGNQTTGSAESAAELAAATGVEISYVTFTRQDAPEVQVTSFTAPSTINADQNFDLNISIQSEATTPARVTVLQGGQIIQQQQVDLREGTNNYTLSLQGIGSGFTDFQVQVDPLSNDGFYQNNQLSTFSRVVGPPRILLVSPSAEESQYIRPALEQAGLNVDEVTPEQIPFNLVPLAQYSSVVLVNVPATRLTPQRMQTLQSYVRDLGGGLVAIGGPQTYGPGGYFRTPLEEALPLDSQVRDQQRLPQLTIAYVIDRSGSMSVPGPSGVPNIELAKEAIIRSMELLQPSDRAGVVSFDAQAYWVARIQPVLDRLTLQRQVGTLTADGGTDILAGMNLVAQDIGPDPSPRKHIILLTDGGADPTGLVELTRRLNEQQSVTTSVIAIGGGPPFLADMARVGGGNYHEVITAEQIPTIFTLETVLATRAYIFEEPFLPTLSSRSPIMNGITSAPQLLGYIATSEKQTAEVILRGPAPYNDPLLASWQYGLGRSVAFTSDATARWSSNWVNWDQFVQFWSQAVRWTITEGTTNNIESRVVMDGEQARLIVDARDNQGGFLNGLDLQLGVIDPTAQANTVTLQQVAPGRYEATFTPGSEGAYVLALNGTGAGDEPVNVRQTTGWVLGYSPEYDQRTQSDGPALLAELAELTGGRSFAGEPGAVFTRNLFARVSGAPIWPLLLLLALLLLPIDIAIRRLIITRTDLVRLRQYLFGRQAAPAATAERMTSLLDAKQRGRQRAEETTANSTVANLRNRKASAQSEATAQPMVPTSSSNRTDSASAPPPTTASEGNVAGTLLKKRRERRGDE
jgi:uncharacterized membrane protein